VANPQLAGNSHVILAAIILSVIGTNAGMGWRARRADESFAPSVPQATLRKREGGNPAGRVDNLLWLGPITRREYLRWAKKMTLVDLHEVWIW
jgi:hypothetical protein